MSSFSLKDVEKLRRSGASVQDIHYSLSTTILNSDNVSANVRTLDHNNGQFEIVVTGTINRSVLDKESGSRTS